MGKKGSMPNYATIDDYISNQSVEARKMLIELREIILDTVPNAQEIVNYKVPSFTLVRGGKRDQQIMMAAYAKFIGFYPFPSTIEHFADELTNFKKGKGSIQFPFDQPLPVDLIARMVKFRKEEIEKDWNV